MIEAIYLKILYSTLHHEPLYSFNTLAPLFNGIFSKTYFDALVLISLSSVLKEYKSSHGVYYIQFLNK